MDPDMVRQQEEEEAASRLRKFVIGRAPSVAVKEDAFVLRAEPREPFKAVAPAAAPASARSVGEPFSGRPPICFSSHLWVCRRYLARHATRSSGWQFLRSAWRWDFCPAGSRQSRCSASATNWEWSSPTARPLVPAFIILFSLVGGLAVILPVITGPSLATAQASQLLVPWLAQPWRRRGGRLRARIAENAGQSARQALIRASHVLLWAADQPVSTGVSASLHSAHDPS